MKQGLFKVLSNERIAKNIYKMRFEGEHAIIKPGQFVNIKLDGMFLRRPISVYNYKENEFEIIYKVVGKGTEYMSNAKYGDVYDILTGLGNGFDTEKCKTNPVLIGGGVGVPPLYALADKLVKQGKNVCAVLGFNTYDEVFCESEFKNLGVKTYVTTADGSYGIKGFVTDALKNINYDYFYACGPEAMLKALNSLNTGGQLSFESRMGCGFGACMGCSCKTKYGNKRICKDGPVLDKEEVIW